MKSSDIVAHKSAVIKAEVPFMMIPQADLIWIMGQKPAIVRLFHECWLSDPYGSRWVQLTTSLKSTAFTEAKKQLSINSLFIFKRETSISDSRLTVCWMVINLHGSRVKDFWKQTALTGTDFVDTKVKPATAVEVSAATKIETATAACIGSETQSEQGLQSVSTTLQYPFNNKTTTLQGKSSSILEKFGRRLFECGIYAECSQGEELIPNPKFAPIRIALTQVPAEQAERGIKTFLSQAQRKQYDYPYAALKDAILKGWDCDRG